MHIYVIYLARSVEGASGYDSCKDSATTNAALSSDIEFLAGSQNMTLAMFLVFTIFATIGCIQNITRDSVQLKKEKVKNGKFNKSQKDRKKKQTTEHEDKYRTKAV